MGHCQELLIRLEKIFSDSVLSQEKHLEILTTSLAREFKISRVSVWKKDTERMGILCLSLFNGATKVHSHGSFLPESLYPTYFAALEKGNLICANDTMEDARTVEFKTDYLEPFEIFSMLDAPIVIDDDVLGVICFELVGKKHEWTAEEIECVSCAARFCAKFFFEKERQRKVNLKNSLYTTLGKLSPGLTHEINNPLAVCFGFLGVLEETLEEKELFHGDIKNQFSSIHHSLERIRALVKEWRSYLYSDYEKQEAIDVHELLRGSLLLLKGFLDKERIQVHLSLNPEDIHMMGNKALLQQYLMNIFLLARESVQRTKRKKGRLEVITKRENAYQMTIIIKDDGVGRDLTEELAPSLELAKMMKGVLEQGKTEVLGNSLSLVLPLNERKEEKAAFPLKLKTHKKTTQTQILIVDDEEEILTLLKTCLEGWGFQVSITTTPQQGLSLLQEEEFQLIISDLKMPEMSGREFLRSAHDLGYGGKFLIISGFFHDLSIEHIEEISMNADDVLKKPFDKTTLMRSIKRLGFEIGERK